MYTRLQIALWSAAVILGLNHCEVDAANQTTKAVNAQLHHSMLANLHHAKHLLDLGLHSIRPITNNPRKLVGLEGYGLRVHERVPIVQPEHSESAGYMRTKRDKLGHLLAS